MKIMITGAHGFLGRNLINQFGSDNELILIDKAPITNEEPVQEYWYQNHRLLSIDLKHDIDQVKDHMKDVDLVIHLANRTRITPSWTDYRDYYDVNIGVSQDLLRIAQDAGVKKFIYASSSSVYGNNNTLRQRESDQLYPTNPYGVSKMAAEFALRVQAQGSFTQLIIVRPFTMYGDFMEFGENALVIAKFLEALENNQPLFIHGNGTQRRDFVHVSDVIEAFKIIINYGQQGDIFNIGTGESVTVKELADVVSEKQVLVPDRKAPVERTEADISRLKFLGYRPRVRVLEWLTEKAQEIKIKKSS